MKTLRSLRGSASGTTTLEFALIIVPLFGFLLTILELGFILYVQSALDYAAMATARQMQTGQTTPGSQSAFRSAVFCPNLAPFLNCANVTLVLQPVTSFQNVTTPTSSYQAGGPDSLMLLQATYTTGLPIWPLNVMTLVGTAAYLNEF